MDYNTLVSEEEEQRLSRVPLTALYEALGQVKDGRKKRGCRYSLALILTLLLARLPGETELRGAAQWITLRKGWILEHLPVKRASVPCLGIYLYALSKIDAQDLLTVVAGCLTRWEAAQRCENEPSRLAGQDGPGWTDQAISEALEVGTATVERVRQRLVEEGLAAALNRHRPHTPRLHKLDGAQEAQLIALACSQPEEGQERWTLQLLANKLVQLQIVESISRETVRQVLEHNELKPWRNKQWCIPPLPINC